MALTTTTAAAVPSRFSAVPTSVWSALKLIAATARSREYIIPHAILASITSKIIRIAGVSGERNLSIRAPPRAPITMIPSSPMLMTPLCSEKHPPRATRIKTEANINVYWIKSNIMLRLLSLLS